MYHYLETGRKLTKYHHWNSWPIQNLILFPSEGLNISIPNREKHLGDFGGLDSVNTNFENSVNYLNF